MYGDNREDLHNILLPIQKCVEWYWNEKNEDIVYMFNNAVLGLKFLKNSYSAYATIQHTIDYYIIILMQKNSTLMSRMGINSIDIDKLTNAILYNDNTTTIPIVLENDSRKQESNKDEGKKNKKKDINNDTKDNTKDNTKEIKDIEQLQDKDDKLSLQMRDIHKFLFDLWNQREINIVINLYKELEHKQKGIERDYIYNNIMQYCEMKENKLYKYIEENSSIL
jgi:hypothetical protein